MTAKAYMIRDAEDGRCVIEFSGHAASARRNGANELGLDFTEVESCVRAPWADQYAPGPVQLSAYLDAGWWFECQSCGTRFDADGRGYGDYDEREDEFSPVEDGRHNYYCSSACMMTDWADRRDRESRGCAVIEATAMRWPQATNIKAYDYYRTGWMAVFSLPGIRYGVKMAPGSRTALVSAHDVDEFTRLYGIREGGSA